jgi:hypothetical protein
MSKMLKHAINDSDPEFKKIVLKDVLIEISNGILTSMEIKDPVFVDSLMQKLDQVNLDELCTYFKVDDNVHVKVFTEIVYNCINKINRDIADPLEIAKAVRKSSVMISEYHQETNAPATIGSESTVTVLECIFDLVLTALVPASQSVAVLTITGEVFKLLQTTVAPLMRQKHWCMC